MPEHRHAIGGHAGAEVPLRSMVANNSGNSLTLRSALARAAAFTFLNPHAYLDTVLLVGSIGARQPPELRGWFIGGAAVASVGWFSALGFGARLLPPFLHGRWRGGFSTPSLD